MDHEALSFPHFPAVFQAVIWRNWEIVPVEQIAEVIGTSIEKVLELADDMGLRTPPVTGKHWLKRGYITMIRNNWHLLPYEQLLKLLDWTMEKLNYILKEDDFLYHKLGDGKPRCEAVKYRPLTEEQKESTKKIRENIWRHFDSEKEAAALPFDFIEHLSEAKAASGKTDIPAGNNLLFIDNTWNLILPSCSVYSGYYAKTFTDDLHIKWGVRLGVSEKANTEKNIYLSIRINNDLLKESHSIEVSEKNIYIEAVDEAGLQRGLQWLEKEMDSRRAPCLEKGKTVRDTRFDIRLIYSYCAVYGDPLSDPDMDPYPDRLLDSLSKLGINGIWLQSVLYSLYPWKYSPQLSSGYEARIEGLRKLTAKAAKYGIGVYLYINEPRSMPLAFFDRFPELKGHAEFEYAALCTSQKPVQDFLYDGMYYLFKKVPGLAGIITITMSENLTNCYSRAVDGKTNCPVCVKRPIYEVVAETNRIIAKGVLDARPDARILCWNWGWAGSMGWHDGMYRKAIDMLPENISLMCTSEDEMPTNVGGVKGSVVDYSMSTVGPGEKSICYWDHAAKKNMRCSAKVQFNNTWECAAVPYIPVPGLVERHIKNLEKTNVTGLMLGWTLGGYPSLNLELASQYYWKSEDQKMLDSGDIALRKYGEKAGGMIKKAWDTLDRAFREFPFCIMTLYTAPQNYGPSNLLFYKDTGLNASMVGFPYDDLTVWRGIYPEDIFEKQFEKLSVGWKKGLDMICSAAPYIDTGDLAGFNDMRHITQSVYCHFRSAYLQIAYIRTRNKFHASSDIGGKALLAARIIELLNEELFTAKELCDIVNIDSRIGYEASNHYFYTSQNLKEKILNCEYLIREFSDHIYGKG